ncbi:MAG: ribonuclease P protein component [Actinomycetota bacterium]|nr:ribonuclease P protein component [Actinomycetota bacterium]
MPDDLWRIGDRATFEALRRTRRRARQGPVGVAHVPPAPGDERVRVAYSVGRAAGPAVRRNRVRRRLRAVMASLAGAGRLAPGAYLVSAGADVERLTFEDLRDLLGALVEQASRRGGARS